MRWELAYSGSSEMQYGDEIQVLASGPFVNEKSVQPLGIVDGSTCWGLWTGGLATRNKKRQRDNWQIPHLIISPIHPDSWPISFHLRVILRDHQGSLSRFLDAIKGCNVDIQFADCSFAGYEHVVLNIIGKFTDLVSWKEMFRDFYLDKNNIQQFNKLWIGSDKLTKKDLSEKINLEDPVYLDSLAQALQSRLPRGLIRHYATVTQQAATDLTIDLMRRNALEWLGRKMLGRLTALWVVARTVEHELYKQAWQAEQDLGRRPAMEDWSWDPESEEDMDPKGDYFFTSKSVQTGRRPWNIEIPFPSSWSEEQPIEDSQKTDLDKIQSEWNKYPDILKELDKDDVKWFSNSEQRVKQLYKSARKTLDLIHATRSVDQKPRLSREAVLAQQSKNHKAWINSIIECILRNNWVHPYVSHAMYELAHASIWRQDAEPLEFRYDGELGQLVVQNGDNLRNAFIRFVTDEQTNKESIGRNDAFPRIAIAAFNTKERFLRLRFIRRDVSDLQIVSFDIGFRITQTTKKMADQDAVNSASAKSASNESPTSEGLLQLLCETAGRHALDLLRVTTRITARYPPHYGYPVLEIGAIKLVGRLPNPVRAGDVSRFEQIFNDCINDPTVNVPFRDHIELHPRVIPWRTTRVFWSTVFNHDRHDELFDLARQAGELFGMELVRVETRTGQATQRIRDEIEQCDAILQLACLRDADKSQAQLSETWQPEYVWLHSEYAIGYALNKPIVRVIDRSMPERICKEFDKVDRDVPVEYIDLRDCQPTLQHVFESIMSEMRGKVGSNKELS